MRIHRDVLDPGKRKELTQATDDLAAAVRSGNVVSVPALRTKLETLLEKSLPHPDQPAVRENVEVLLVAVIVAMAVRTFFFQPFKIPTGSMQPTLFGIQQNVACDENASLPKRLFELVAWGISHEDGVCTEHGDHIFVDRFTYHFRKPHRGEVIVFDTSEIRDIPEASRGKFYIKRLIGLPGDKIEIDPPHVLVNDQILDDRRAFQRIYSKENGYSGYILPGANDFFTPPPKYLNSRNPVYYIPPDHLFVLGDNSKSSLDGRFWGSLPRHALVGRAVLVYWPFTRRFGPID